MSRLYEKNYFEEYGGAGYKPGSAYRYLRPFANSVKTLFAKNSHLKVLDVGCAKGYLVKLLREFKLVEAWGVDVSRYAVENCPAEIKSYFGKA